MAEQHLKFEEAMQALEHIVAELEAGNVSLDDSLELYEKGMALVRSCNAALEHAEKRVLAIRETENGTVTEPFSTGDRAE